MSCSATTSVNSFTGGGIGAAGVDEVGGGSGARGTAGCGETTGAAGSVTAAPVGAGACACTSWGRFAQPTRIKARMRRANPARRDFPYIMDRLSFRFNDVQRGSRIHMPGGHEERPQIVREPLFLRKTLFYQAPAVSKSDGRPDESELDPPAELDDAVRRDTEEVGRGAGVPRHEREEALPPSHHRRGPDRKQPRAANIIRRLLRIGGHAVVAAQRDHVLDVGPLHEAVIRSDAIEALGQALARDPPVVRYLRYLLGDDRDEDDLFVQDLVVPEVEHEARRGALDVRRDEHGRG